MSPTEGFAVTPESAGARCAACPLAWGAALGRQSGADPQAGPEQAGGRRLSLLSRPVPSAIRQELSGISTS